MIAKREGADRIVRPEPRQSLRALVGFLMTQSIELVKDEVALAKAELREKARLCISAALIMAVGFAFGLLAAMALVAAGIIALSIYTGMAASALIFGGALGAPATLLLMRGLRRFKRHSP
jgi:uncharacterized membrane protein YqjE